MINSKYKMNPDSLYLLTIKSKIMKKNVLNLAKNRINQEQLKNTKGGQEGSGNSLIGGGCSCSLVICFDNCLGGGSRSSEKYGQGDAKRAYRRQA